MWKYLKSFFVKNNQSEQDDQDDKDYKLVHYELKLSWYNNFTKFTTKIKHKTFPKEIKIFDILNEYIPLYNKLTIQPRLIDYLYRTRTAMFSSDFKSGIYHLDSIKILKGYEKNNGIIEYKPAITEAVYDISIEIDSEGEWKFARE